MRRLRVLLLTSREILNPAEGIIGEGPCCAFGNKEIEDYIELLTACNMPFDIKYDDELTFDAIIDGTNIQYSTIVLTVSENIIAQEKIEIINRVSFEFGVSVIASYSHVGQQTKRFFGIIDKNNIKYCFPCSIVIDTDKLDDTNIESEIKLGDGLKIPLQKWGLKRHPVRYFQRHLKKIWQQVYSYQKITVASETETFASIKGTTDPAVIGCQYGKATNYYIALHSDHYLDRFNSLHRVVREIIRKNSGGGMVECNLEGVMVLRMDDPGTCERIYLSGYDTELLSETDWQEIAGVLQKHNAKLSVMYVPLWVDDGNPDNGKLVIQGQEVADRPKGAIYHSKDVCFVKNTQSGPLTYDYTQEYQALQGCFAQGWLEIESHGLTHVDPDIHRWAVAPDRYFNFDWYHEFRHVHGNRDVTEAEQRYVVRQSAQEIYTNFGVWPTAITPSGHEQSGDSEQIAHDCGFKLFSSEYTCVKKDDYAVRNGKLQSVFLEFADPGPAYMHAGYPVIGVFHDYEIAKLGTDWLEQTLTSWEKAGFSRFITLRELAGYLCASFEAFHKRDSLSIAVDISGAGDMQNTPGSAYFSQHHMTIDITLPADKQVDSLYVDEKPWQHFHSHIAEGRLKVDLPFFKGKNRQEIIVTFS